jgi:hypothetical protein
MTIEAEPIDRQKLVLVTIAGTLMSALGRALDEIARMKGAAAEEWLNDFERQMTTDAKNMVTQDIATTQIVQGVDAAVSTVQTIVEEARKKLPPRRS